MPFERQTNGAAQGLVDQHVVVTDDAAMAFLKRLVLTTWVLVL